MAVILYLDSILWHGLSPGPENQYLSGIIHKKTKTIWYTRNKYKDTFISDMQACWGNVYFSDCRQSSLLLLTFKFLNISVTVQAYSTSDFLNEPSSLINAII